MASTNALASSNSKTTNNPGRTSDNDSDVDFEEEPVLCHFFSKMTHNSSLLEFSNQNKEDCGKCDLYPFPRLEKNNEIKCLTDTTELDEFYGLDIESIIDCDKNCSHDTWIPSNFTYNFLKDVKHNSEKYILYKQSLTVPVISFKDCMVDGISKLVSQKLGETEAMQHNVLNAHDVTQDVYGLRELISLGHYKSAVDLTGKLLISLKQGLWNEEYSSLSKHSVNSIQIWFTRFSLLAKLQEWAALDVEASAWKNLDGPDLYYQFYPEEYGNSEGSMVPFQMRLLLAIIPSYLDRYTESFNRLLYILEVVKKILLRLELNMGDPDINVCVHCVKVWKARENRVIIYLANVALKMKDFCLVVEVVNSLITNERGSATKRMLFSTLGRIYLQIGDISAAKKCFDNARNCLQIEGSLEHCTDFHDFIDRGLLAFAFDNFEEAYKHFEMASYIDPSNTMVMNNCAICLMYMGHLKEAIRLLSGVISNNPVRALHDNVVLNLSTLYELESSNHTIKKLQLLKLISMHNNDMIKTSSLKIPL